MHFRLITLSILLFFLLQTPSWAKYPMLDISSPLLVDANAIVRVDSCFLEIKNNQKSTAFYKYAITILNSSANYKGAFHTYYDNFSSVKGLSIQIYDKYGVLKKAVKKSEIIDKPVFGSYSEVTDDREIIYEPAETHYPYTIEYEYTINYDNLFHLRSWFFQGDNKISVEKSIFVLKAPNAHPFHYQDVHYDEAPVVTKEEEYSLYRWEKKHLTTFKLEPYGYTEQKLLSRLSLRSDQFKYGDISGDYLSWKSFGKWAYELNKERDGLSPQTIEKVKLLTSGSKTVDEKIDLVYKYVQSRTRYVSVQLGIGGFRTFPASYVDKYGIGDCKALSNYTMALLKAIDIPSFLALVKANQTSNDIEIDFVSSQFNHVILCVPMTQDTVWLECTSQNYPTGFLGDFTFDKHALLITPEGGKLIKTPSSTKQQNRTIRTTRITLNDNIEKGYLTSKSRYMGTMADERYELRSSEHDAKVKWVQDNMRLNNAQVKQVTMETKEEASPYVAETIQLETDHLLTKSNGFYFCYPMIFEQSLEIPESLENRTQPVFINTDYSISDTTIYQLPTTAKVEMLPDIKTETPFGYYSMTLKKDGDNLIWIRQLGINKGTYPKESYPEWVKFLKTTAKGDRSKAIVTF